MWLARDFDYTLFWEKPTWNKMNQIFYLVGGDYMCFGEDNPTGISVEKNQCVKVKLVKDEDG